jgi:hypothetical protein
VIIGAACMAVRRYLREYVPLIKISMPYTVMHSNIQLPMLLVTFSHTRTKCPGIFKMVGHIQNLIRHHYARAHNGDK